MLRSSLSQPPFRVGNGFVVGRDSLIANGGCGIVYRAKTQSDSGLPPQVVLKCLRQFDALRDSADAYRELRNRFLVESDFLKRHPSNRLPHFYGEGELPDGRPWYAMELLDSVEFRNEIFLASATDADRVKCLLDVLASVEEIHNTGYVHEDIKPHNVMFRREDGHYLLVDFGTVHCREDIDKDEYHFGTGGYDAPEKGHGVGRDIFALGQVIRDMFPAEVPIKWNLIIGRCISRRPEYRYKSVDALRKDLLRLDELGRQEMERRILEWRTESVQDQKKLVALPQKSIDWKSLKERLRATCAGDDQFHVGETEMLIDFTALNAGGGETLWRSIEVADPIVLSQESLVVIRGPGILRADLSPMFSARRVIVLMNHATLIDTSNRLPQTRGIVYCVGEHCYVNLPNITKGVPLPASTYRLSSAGDAFIRCGGPDCVADIVSHADGVLWSGRRNVTDDELFGTGPYVPVPKKKLDATANPMKKGLASYIWDNDGSDGKTEGEYLQAMGVQVPSLIDQLVAAFGHDPFPKTTSSDARLFPIGAIVGSIAGSWYTHHTEKDPSKITLFTGHPNRLPVDAEMTIAIAAAFCGCDSSKANLGTCAAAAMRIFGRAMPFTFGERFRNWIFDDDAGAYGSFGNGAAMRVSPCAWAAKDLDEALRLAEAVTAVTHNHSEGIRGAKAVTEAIFLAREMSAGRLTKDKKVLYSQVIEKYYPERLNDLSFTLDALRPDYKYDDSCPGSVPQAIRVFYEAEDFEQAVRLAISLGGDADTQASIAGAIAEAYYGVPESLAQSAFQYLDETRKNILTAFAAANIFDAVRKWEET